jgi:hypothetical protein
MKKLARVILLHGLMLGICAMSVAASPILSIQPPSRSVQPDRDFSFSVRVADITDLFAFQFDLAFDPAILSAASVTEGSFLRNGGSTVFVPGTINNTAGTINFTGDSLIGPIQGVSGSGTLATVNFQAFRPGMSPIALSNVVLLDSDLRGITANTVNGTVTVIPEPASWLLLAAGA